MPLIRLCSRTWVVLPHRNASITVALATSQRTAASRRYSWEWSVTQKIPFSTGRAALGDQQRPLRTTDPDIDIDSLRNTLQAVREANRASLAVRKGSQTGRAAKVRRRPRLRFAQAEISADSQPQLRRSLDHSSQYVNEEKRKRTVKKVEVLATTSDHSITGTTELDEDVGTIRELTSFWRPADEDRTLPARLRLPWLVNLPESTGWTSAIDRLSAEIRAFEQYVTPSEEEQLVVETALQDLTQAIKYTDHDLDVDVIGSRATGIADPLSDLDINVWKPRTPATMSKPKTPVQILALLEKAFRGTHEKIKLGFRPVEVIYNLRTARVPILLCRHKFSGLSIQIQCTPPTYDSTEYVKAFLREYPTLKSLFKVLKQLLLMRGLTVGSHGGLTSYPLLNMIVAALKFSEGQIHPSDAGKQLLFFLDMYSEMDFSSQGISTRPLQFFPKRTSGKHGRHKATVSSGQTPSLSELFPQELAGQRKMTLHRGKAAYLMTLQDPANPFNDVGRSAYMIKDVQATLISVRSNLNQAIKEWDQSSPDFKTQQGSPRPQALLESCLGADYRIYEQERGDMKALGRQLLISTKVQQ
ncbi:hypothetical protein ABEF93_003709 [Exophiala dermatitidis]